MVCDCHMHMVLDGIDWRAAIGRHRLQVDEAFVRRVLAAYRDKGYSYLRDGGDRWGVGKAAREMAEEFGIRYRTPLAPLCKKGHYAMHTLKGNTGSIGIGMCGMLGFCRPDLDYRFPLTASQVESCFYMSALLCKQYAILPVKDCVTTIFFYHITWYYYISF